MGMVVRRGEMDCGCASLSLPGLGRQWEREKKKKRRLSSEVRSLGDAQ
jgi:hypothetical protein